MEMEGAAGSMYEHSIKAIRELLKDRYPDIGPVFFDDISSMEKVPEALVAHILAMLDSVEAGGMTESRAGRWMGWVYRALEAYPLQLIDNMRSRDWARRDSLAAKDIIAEERLRARNLLEFFMMGEVPEECPYWAEPCPVDGEPCGHEGAGSSFGCGRRYKATLDAAQKCAEEGRSLVGG